MGKRYYVYDKIDGGYLMFEGEYAEFGQKYVDEMEPSVLFISFVEKEEAEKELRALGNYYGGLNIGD